MAQDVWGVLRGLGLGSDTEATDDVEWLDSVEATRGRLAALTPGVVAECLSIHPLPSSREAFASARGLNREALERGVALRGLRHDSCRQDAPTLQHMTWLAQRGAQIRTAPLLPVKMIIFDRRTAIVELDAEDPGLGAVQLASPGVVGALHALFERIWKDANEFGAPPHERRDDGISANERELLRLMLDGHTDESAARKLGISLRTVRRMMAGLAARLGARSRFQVGALAQERGWLDP